MLERHFRIVLGGWLVVAAYLDSAAMTIGLIVVLLFEGITNLRVPMLLSRLRFGKAASNDVPYVNPHAKFEFEAERALRLILAVFAAIPELPGAAAMWWLPWFVGFAVIGSGLSGICPMVLSLRRLGLR